jgi:hypothetical protein
MASTAPSLGTVLVNRKANERPKGEYRFYQIRGRPPPPHSSLSIVHIVRNSLSDNNDAAHHQLSFVLSSTQSGRFSSVQSARKYA